MGLPEVQVYDPQAWADYDDLYDKLLAVGKMDWERAQEGQEHEPRPPGLPRQR